MADTTTSLLQLVLQDTGNNDNNWGVILNQQLQRIETAIAGTTLLSITGGTTILTDMQALSETILLQGSLTSDAVIQVPAHFKTWVVGNFTAGSFKVSIKTASGLPTIMTRNSYVHYFCDGSGVGLVGDAGMVPVGSIVDFAGTDISALPNYLPCTGATVSRSTYARLFAAIGTTWGAGDGSTTFNIPDGRERYRRTAGWVNAPGAMLACDIQSHSHTASMDTQGSHSHGGSTSSIADHTHQYIETISGQIGLQGGSSVLNTISSQDITQSGGAGGHSHTIATDTQGSHSHNITVGSVGGGETLPNSWTVSSLIRAS